MKKQKLPVALKHSFLFLAFAAIMGFSSGSNQKPGAISHPFSLLTETQFYVNISKIVNGLGISQHDLAQTMLEAERRKSEDQTASNYVENYMNTHFRLAPVAVMSSTNRVSIAAPGQSDQNMSVACNQTALKEVISSTVGYYYAFAIKCDGTYKYDAANFTGGSTVYVRAEASNYIHEAFILF